MKNKKAVDRIKEKILSSEFKKLSLTADYKQKLSDFFLQEYNHYEQEMKEMYDRT